jgi:hypothetical protein
VYPEQDYLEQLGRALYAMNYCEYLAVEVTCWLNPNLDFARLASSDGGTIARELKAATTRAGSTIPGDAHHAADDFGRLVDDRNDVVHARPSTDNEGRQRLFRWAPARSRATTQTITSDVLVTLAENAFGG